MGNNTKNINVKELAGFVSDIMKRNTDVDTAIEDFLVKMGAFFDVDSIGPGMTSKVYVAFNDMLEGNDYYMIYNEGYITDDIKGSVYTVVN